MDSYQDVIVLYQGSSVARKGGPNENFPVTDVNTLMVIKHSQIQKKIMDIFVKYRLMLLQ